MKVLIGKYHYCFSENFIPDVIEQYSWQVDSECLVRFDFTALNDDCSINKNYNKVYAVVRFIPDCEPVVTVYGKYKMAEIVSKVCEMRGMRVHRFSRDVMYQGWHCERYEGVGVVTDGDFRLF